MLHTAHLRRATIQSVQPFPHQLNCQWTIAARRSSTLSRVRVSRRSEAEEKSKSINAAVLLSGLGLAGATQGPLLDGIHGSVDLLQYKVAQFDLGGLHSSLWVPVLLGIYYMVLGVFHILLDDIALEGTYTASLANNPILESIKQKLSLDTNKAATLKARNGQSWPSLALNVGILASLLFLSAQLYKNGTPYPQIAAILFALGALNWKSFDGTKQGVWLGLLMAVLAPLSELVIINGFGLWQYPHPDVFGTGGVPSWVSSCYFFYTPAVGNLARLLNKSQ